MDDGVLITAEALAGCIGDANVAVLDCRFDLLDPGAGRLAYRQAHIPGAVYADLDRDLARVPGPADGRHPLPAAADARRTFEALGADDAGRVVVYDDASGAIAARAWWMLRWLGHDDVRLLDGGWARWQRLGLPTRSGEERPDPGALTGPIRDDRVVSLDSVVDGEVSFLIDARAGVRFRGEVEPIDPVAGHIPGALNLPTDGNVDIDGNWLPASTLRQRWASTLATVDADSAALADAAVMCGSGVTACHLAASAVRAGLPEPRVFVGSWSQWIRDSRRPIATAVD